MLAGTQSKGGVCAEEVGGGGWLRMLLFVFSVRGKAADQRESFPGAREELGPGLPEAVPRTQVLLAAHRRFSGRGHAVDRHPYTQHADPCEAPADRGNRVGITRRTESQRGPGVFSAYDSGPLRVERLKELG